MRDGIHTGRTMAGRIDSAKARCPSCDARLMYGDPRPSATWPRRLRLDDETRDLLLIAAAEFAELSVEAEEPESSVAFVDWVGGVGRHGPYVEADGAPGRSESGGFARHGSYRHRHPFPIPTVSLPPKLRGPGHGA